jgi:hypothetical protein
LRIDGCAAVNEFVVPNRQSLNLAEIKENTGGRAVDDFIADNGEVGGQIGLYDVFIAADRAE